MLQRGATTAMNVSNFFMIIEQSSNFHDAAFKLSAFTTKL